MHLPLHLAAAAPTQHQVLAGQQQHTAGRIQAHHAVLQLEQGLLSLNSTAT
jgi:hypothetical protein